LRRSLPLPGRTRWSFPSLRRGRPGLREFRTAPLRAHLPRHDPHAKAPSPTYLRVTAATRARSSQNPSRLTSCAAEAGSPSLATVVAFLHRRLPAVVKASRSDARRRGGPWFRLNSSSCPASPYRARRSSRRRTVPLIRAVRRRRRLAGVPSTLDRFLASLTSPWRKPCSESSPQLEFGRAGDVRRSRCCAPLPVAAPTASRPSSDRRLRSDLNLSQPGGYRSTRLSHCCFAIKPLGFSGFTNRSSRSRKFFTVRSFCYV
jgi:hypothetical protein